MSTFKLFIAMQTSVVVVSDRIYFSAIYGNPWNL